MQEHNLGEKKRIPQHNSANLRSSSFIYLLNGILLEPLSFWGLANIAALAKLFLTGNFISLTYTLHLGNHCLQFISSVFTWTHNTCHLFSFLVTISSKSCFWNQSIYFPFFVVYASFTTVKIHSFSLYSLEAYCVFKLSCRARQTSNFYFTICSLFFCSLSQNLLLHNFCS